MAVCGGQLTDYQANKIADAIYKIEGGAKAKVAYGILSVKVNNEAEARKVCLNTIRNNHARWQKSTNKNYFFFLADKYCPPISDPVGNRRWKTNIVKILGTTFVGQVNQRK